MKKAQPVTIEGRDWYPYAIEFDSPDGSFALRLYALSREHAELLLLDLKQTGRIVGEIVGEISI